MRASAVSVSDPLPVLRASFTTMTRLAAAVPPGVIAAVVGDSCKSPVAMSVSVEVTSVPNAESIASSLANRRAEMPQTTPPVPESAVQVTEAVNVLPVHPVGVRTRTVADSSVEESKSTVS